MAQALRYAAACFRRTAMGSAATPFNAHQRMPWILLLCLGLCDLTISAGVHGASVLTPPQGNSLRTKAKTRGGKYLYNCLGGEWIPVLAAAELVSIPDRKTALGNYSLAYRRRNPRFVGTWYLKNDDADFAESGAEAAIVAGNEIASEPAAQPASLAEILAEATFHKYEGTASRVSYVQRRNTRGGIPASSDRCRETSTTAVSFEAEFWFYTQDAIPPPVPAAVKVPSGRMVEGFFCKGVIAYAFDGSGWRRTKMHGNLFTLPGGSPTGRFDVAFTFPENDGGNFLLTAYNPDGWSVTAKLAGRSVQMADDCLPWALYRITGGTGNVSLLGPFDYYQMIGTRGGVPPNPSNATEKGATWIGVFSNQFWIYANV